MQEGEILTPDMQPIPFNNVTITAYLDYSAVTEQAYHNIKTIAPTWSPSRSLWPGIAPEEVVKAFSKKNREREKDSSKGVRPETAHDPLVRLIANPVATRDSLHLSVAPLSWDLYSVTKRYPDQEPSELLGRYRPTTEVLQTMEEFKRKFSESYPGDSKPLVGPRNFVPLGLEALVVTSDNRAFLRLKDVTTTVGGLNWDVSFSGYARFTTTCCVDSPADMGRVALNLDRWAAYEFHRETAVEIGNIENSVVLGVHRNKISGAIDVLAFCQVTLHSKTIAYELYIKPRLEQEKKEAKDKGISWTYEKRKEELLADFESTGYILGSQGASEREVWQSRGKFIPFTPTEVEKFLVNDVVAFKQKLLPEAQQVLLGSLYAHFGEIPNSLVNAIRG